MRKKGKKQVTMWLPDALVKQLEAEAAERDLPRSTVIENAIRSMMGLPSLNEAAFGTRRDYVERKKRQKK